MFEWPETAIQIGLVVVVAVAARIILHFGIRRVVDATVKSAKLAAENPKKRIGVDVARVRARTGALASMLRSVSTVVIVIVAVMMIMQILGLPLAPLLASAGVGGLALGFGAQSIVKDLLSGIFMIIEDQYGVGDVVDTGDVIGTVEEVTLRITKLRDYDGVIWYIRNGEILRIANKTQGWNTAWVDFPVAYNADPARTIAVLEATCEDVYADPEWNEKMLEKPIVLGVGEVQNGTMTVKAMAKCLPETHWGVKRELLEVGMSRLRAAGIPGPILFSTPNADGPGAFGPGTETSSADHPDPRA